jgi:hypothetical protein
MKSPILILLPSIGRPESLCFAVESMVKNALGIFDLLVLQGGDECNQAMNQVPLDLISQHEIIGIMNDDARMRTRSWDRLVIDSFAGRPGLVYGRDGIKDESLCTLPFISSRMIQALGFVMPPGLHYYADDYWMEISNHYQARWYVPELFIEHLHFSVGKSPMDATYQRGSDHWQYDVSAWQEYRRTRLPMDIEKLRTIFHP